MDMNKMSKYRTLQSRQVAVQNECVKDIHEKQACCSFKPGKIFSTSELETMYM